jgi:protocatechuate 3,4-dioxygenase beta subunit
MATLASSSIAAYHNAKNPARCQLQSRGTQINLLSRSISVVIPAKAGIQAIPISGAKGANAEGEQSATNDLASKTSACKITPMKTENDSILTRRGFLAASLIATDLLFDRALDAVAATVDLAPTPACADTDDITPPQTAGPFYKPRSPERKSLLEPGIQGSKIVLEGIVRSTKCKPIAGALVDFWQADGNGVYDNTGFKLRGHQFTDGAGRYRLETVVPGVYPGRARHFHVRVQSPNRPALTTQLYFPSEPENQRDFIFNPKLVIVLGGSASAKAASFNFVLDVG